MPDRVIHVRGIPKPQGRARATSFRTPDGQVRSRVHDDGKSIDWKNAIAAAAADEINEQLQGPLSIGIDFYFPRPKRLQRKKDPEEPIWHTSKPDRDNLEKAVLDALKSLAGILSDDCIVCAGEVRKFYVAKGGLPGAVITITKLNP